MSTDEDPRPEDASAAPPADTESAVEQAFERVLKGRRRDEEGSSMRIVIPSNLLETDVSSMPQLLDSVMAEWEDIEKLLETLSERREGEEASEDQVIEDAVAVVSARTLEDPEELTRALKPLQSETMRLEFLYARAKYGLDRLSEYRLSELESDDLVKVLRTQQNIQAVQNLVGFLRTLNRAAESFEALSLPRSQIRGYLQQLYSMEDWREMESWVRWLESAVARLAEEEVGES